MFYIHFDETENLLKLRIEQYFDEPEAKEWSRQVEVCLEKIPVGFKILTDLRDLETFDKSAVQYLDSVMDACNGKGVSKIVRIIPDKTKISPARI